MFEFKTKEVIIIIIGLVMITAIVAGAVILNDYLFVKNGYTTCSIPGLTGRQWCKF